MQLSHSFSELVARRFDWAGWEHLIEHNGLTIERPHGSQHPSFPEIIYPLDYGYVNGTMSSDGAEVDIFSGSARNGLVALIISEDHRQLDREFNLLYHCTPEEIYLAHGFINFNPTLMEGLLVMRRPMHALWSS